MSHIRYNAAGSVTGWQWADGTTYSKTYDANGRLKTFPLGNTTRTLRYDATSNITGWDDNGDAAKAKHFSYDLLDRLDGYTAADEAQAFQYDLNGNRTLKTDNGNTTAYAIQPNSNRLTHIGSTAQAQDANGNLLNDGTHSYTYNAQNRLASVDGTTTYTYNADNQRVRKTSPQGITLYAWDNDRIIGEYTQDNQNVMAQASETVYFGNTPVAVIQDGNLYRIYADQIDTPRVITDATGKTVWAWDSKPFGETLPDEDPDKDGLNLHYSQRFPGQTYDAETGLHYNFHRDYNPATGRYVQSDPIGLEGGLNTFGYVGGSPLLLVDASGLVAFKTLQNNYQPESFIQKAGGNLKTQFNNRSLGTSCAIRLSNAYNRSGEPIPATPKITLKDANNNSYMFRASDLASYLGVTKKLTTQEFGSIRMNKKTGVIYFKRYLSTNGTGVSHIDLLNSSGSLVGNGTINSRQTVADGIYFKEVK